MAKSIFYKVKVFKFLDGSTKIDLSDKSIKAVGVVRAILNECAERVGMDNDLLHIEDGINYQVKSPLQESLERQKAEGKRDRDKPLPTKFVKTGREKLTDFKINKTASEQDILWKAEFVIYPDDRKRNTFKAQYHKTAPQKYRTLIESHEDIISTLEHKRAAERVLGMEKQSFFSKLFKK